MMSFLNTGIEKQLIDKNGRIEYKLMKNRESATKSANKPAARSIQYSISQNDSSISIAKGLDYDDDKKAD